MHERDSRWGDLFRRANRGDRVAYATFLTEVTLVIRKIVAARSGGQMSEIEDTVQEVLIAIHTKRHTWRETEPVTPWVYAIARYKTADAWRRRRQVLVPIEDMADSLPDAGTGDAMAARDLGVMLGGLDARSAQIVRAVGVDGDSASEVGARMGMNEGAVRVAFHRAMTRLRQRAGTSDGDSE